MSAYDKLEHVQAFRRNGEFPAIHRDMAAALGMHYERGGLLDLGACTGLLAVQARSLGYRPVLAVEQSEAYANVFENLLAAMVDVKFHKHTVRPFDADSMAWLQQLIARNNIATVAARRCLPEILGGSQGESMKFCRSAGQRLTATLLAGGVRHIVIEGRMPSLAATHALHLLDSEIDALGAGWHPVWKQGRCAILQATPPPF